ncbi:CPBP family intramembrane metalloprotease [Chryseobacterium sp. L7]|uniref:CPBP family intramembrane metalloprotease n=1 Tax=Chryseobacterium endalhagicum TaxID=2797638 RepID=A0ABS1QGK7_9FLAO|nr:type II CAAX endopeptidase family protein [Chryseobacterium endalhagicum]MBL1221752.1 CPBP family intramembrane metalloprotease [Chryseobacterium endalhagicum]
MKNSITLFLIPIFSYALYSVVSYHFETIMKFFDGYIRFPLLSYFLVYVLAVIPLLISLRIIAGKNMFETIGLHPRGLVKGIGLSLLFILPMALYGLLFSKLNIQIDPANLFAKSFLAGLFEEIIYRAFIFGILFRFVRLGFVPSVAVASFIFALGHLYQGTQMIDLIEIFTLTFLASILYAWLYTEWNFNLWVPIILHSFMNLIWMVFNFDDTVIGSWGANICRFLTVGFSVVYTIRFKLKNEIPLSVNRKTLWKFNSEKYSDQIK